MAQIRFQVQGRLAGSAARDAENEANTAPAWDFHVRAGSAARDAEERKRAESFGASSTGFALRAHNGSIQRIGSSDRVGGAVTPPANTNSVAAYKASDSDGAALLPLDASTSATPPDSSHGSTVEAAPAATTSSLLRRLFPSFGKNS